VYIYHHHHHHLNLSILLIVWFDLQLFMVDLVDIGLMNVTEAAGRQRLNETIDQLADFIQNGLTGTVGNIRFGVTSLRQCASGDGINDGCSNGTALATNSPSPPISSGIGTPGCIIYWLFAIMVILLYYA